MSRPVTALIGLTAAIAALGLAASPAAAIKPGSGSDTPDSTGFADGSTLGADESASTIDEADVAPPAEGGER